MEDRDEAQAAITEAEVELKANRLGLFQNDPQNRQVIANRINELLDKIETFDFAWFDITTQAALARSLVHIVNDCDGVTLNDLKIAVAVGYILGIEAAPNERME